MVQINSALQAVTVALLTGATVAHPGAEHHHHARNDHSTVSARSNFVSKTRRSLADCAPILKARGHEAKAIARRRAHAEKAGKLALAKRERYSDSNSTIVAGINHNATNVWNISMSSPESDIFATVLNNSCILVPEVTQGPYYVSGEYIREDGDVREDEEGVDLYLDVQVIDIATCLPVTNAMVDWWHANSTGVYSGINADGNGDSSDLTNLNKTFLRGLIATDSDGVAAVVDKFGGHYDGRATHTHMAVRLNGSIADNGTYIGGTISHIGQIFWDAALITAVNSIEPYVSNTDVITANVDDNVYPDEAVGYDPVPNYMYLGGDIADGLFAWTTVGVDLTKDSDISAAAALTASGGVQDDSTSAGTSIGGGA